MISLSSKPIMLVSNSSEKFEGSEESYQFGNFKFPLDEFQKHALSSIYNGRNVLVNAATGNGKTVPAKAAIRYALLNNKKAIYTAPIKALLNQKYHEFSLEFDDVGIETGDKRLNPQAQCMVVTTEILRNWLFFKSEDNEEKLANVGIVIFDEVHYLNDKERGSTWEESISFLPSSVQQVMLSATISKPDEFGRWVELVQPDRELHLINVPTRKVPLSYFLIKKDKFDSDNDKLVQFMDNDRIFDTGTYTKYYKSVVPSGNYHQNLSSSLKFLERLDMFPAVYFVMSKKLCNKYARSIQRSLVSGEESMQIIKDFEQLLRKCSDIEKNTAQIEMVKSCLSKGVGIHHAGLVANLKEIVEIIFSKGLIKVLFATGTFTVGLNMPIRTVVNTGMTVYDKQVGMRYYNSDEIIQACGRAGRRGLDEVGNVVFLPLKEELPPPHEMKTIMTGQPNSIKSKSDLGYKTVIDLAHLGKTEKDIVKLTDSSLLGIENKATISLLKSELEAKQKNTTDIVVSERLKEYDELSAQICSGTLKANQLKKKKAKLASMETDELLEQHAKLIKIREKQLSAERTEQDIDWLSSWKEERVKILIRYLMDSAYLKLEGDNIVLEKRGIVASMVTGYNKILFTEMILSEQVKLSQLSTREIVVMLSLFLDDKEDDTSENELAKYGTSINLTTSMKAMKEIIKEYRNYEYSYGLRSDYDPLSIRTNWELSMSNAIPVLLWLDGDKVVSEIVEPELEGNFISNMSMLGQIIVMVSSIADVIQDSVLKKKMEEAHKLVVRDIVIPNSLYF